MSPSHEHTTRHALFATVPRVASMLVFLSMAGCASHTGGDDDAGLLDAGTRPSVGCGQESATYGVGTTAAQIVHAGLTRTFRVHVPPGSSASALPVVIMLHGGGGSGRQLEEDSSGMDVIADREGFIAVYPDGTGVVKTWNAGGCCGAAVANNADDVGFIAALIDHLEGAMCIDRSRIFVSGMSNGGMMSHRIACELSDRIAAAAPVSGTDMTAACAPTRNVPIMQVHGTADGHVQWEGGEGCGPANVSFTSVPTTMSRWQSRNGCTASSTPYFDEGNGHCERYTGCEDGADVVLCAIESSGHSWPGGEPPADVVPCPADGPQSSSFHASEAIWRFFADHPMP